MAFVSRDMFPDRNKNNGSHSIKDRKSTDIMEVNHGRIFCSSFKGRLRI